MVFAQITFKTTMLTFSRFSRYFIEVARLGSLRKAADALNVSASAIDRQILLAEEELGTALFERLPSGLKLTVAGELLLGDVRRWRKEYTRTLERFDELQDMRRGHVSIAFIDALSEGQLAHTVARIGADYPGLTFDLQVTPNNRVIDAIQAAEVDFGLLLDPALHVQLEVRALTQIPMGVVMPVDHPLAGENRLALGKILAYRQILPAAPLMIHAHIDRLYARHQIHLQQPVVCNNVRMIRSLIAQGVGVGILSWLDVAADVAAGRLAFVPLHERQIKPLTLALCIAPKRQLSRAAQMVIQQVTQAMQHLPVTA